MAPTLSGTARADDAIRFAFSDVADGNISLAVGESDAGARSRLARAVGARRRDLVFMQQIHGGTVAVVGARERGRGLDAHADGVESVDGLVTRQADVGLVVQVADCVPLLLADPHASVAAVHVGRGGVVADVVGAAVAAMAPVSSARVEAAIGPAIGGCCYEVEEDLVDAVGADVPEARTTTTWGTPALDLPSAVAAQLRAAGVSTITRYGGCTRCAPGGRWFSHRRQPGHGRQAGIVIRRAHAGGPHA